MHYNGITLFIGILATCIMYFRYHKKYYMWKTTVEEELEKDIIPDTIKYYNRKDGITINVKEH